MDELTREFLIESQEGLDRMERGLTDLEARPDDSALLADIFRAVHTIKGTTGFLGYKRLETLAHAGENLLGLLRDGKLAANPEVITTLLQLLDGLRSILNTIEQHGDEQADAGEANEADLIARLNEFQQAGSSPAAVCISGEPRARTKASRTSATRRHPRPQPAQRGALPLDPLVPARRTVPAAEAPASDEPCVLSTTAARDLPAVPAQAIEETSKAAPLPAAVSAADSTLRVDVALLNRMMNLVGELVLTRNQVLQATAPDPSMTMLSRRLDMVTADLREAVMKARMQPVSNIFSKMPRMVRDLSHTLGRTVRLEIEGQDTELDKSLLEAIKDPLIHAVRNALDHGLEPPDIRLAAGKNPEGVLKLSAAQHGSHVIVEIADDGSGIAVDRVRDKAIERGLITRDRAGQLSDRELLQMIFVPGFSTAAKVTNVSGRGVGMDVVRTNVEKIGGKVEIDSRAGAGTTLRLRIPLTLAIIPALIVRSLGQSFAVPQAALSELVRVGPADAAKAIEWVENAPVYRLRGQFLPLIFLDRLLGADSTALQCQNHFIAVLDADGRRYGLVVDGLADPEEIVVKPLSPVLKNIGLYSGATVLGNAELALILDPGAIAAMAGVRLSEDALRGAAKPEADTQDASRREYLVVRVAGRQAAVPLESVLRIEQVPLARFEYVRQRPVLNYSGQLIAVEDAAGLIGRAASDPVATIIVVVCRDGSRLVGIAVEHVLDVAAGGDLFEAGSSHAACGFSLVCDKVTGVVDVKDVALLPIRAECETQEMFVV